MPGGGERVCSSLWYSQIPDLFWVVGSTVDTAASMSYLPLVLWHTCIGVPRLSQNHSVVATMTLVLLPGLHFLTCLARVAPDLAFGIAIILVAVSVLSP